MKVIELDFIEDGVLELDSDKPNSIIHRLFIISDDRKPLAPSTINRQHAKDFKNYMINYDNLNIMIENDPELNFHQIITEVDLEPEMIDELKIKTYGTILKSDDIFSFDIKNSLFI